MGTPEGPLDPPIGSPLDPLGGPWTPQRPLVPPYENAKFRDQIKKNSSAPGGRTRNALARRVSFEDVEVLVWMRLPLAFVDSLLGRSLSSSFASVLLQT